MSASTRAIQQPIGRGSIYSAVLMAAAVLFAVVAITWGAANLVATKSVAAPIPAPIYLDRGGRNDLLPAATTGGAASKTVSGHGGFRAK